MKEEVYKAFLKDEGLEVAFEKFAEATEPLTIDTHNYYRMDKTALEDGDWSGEYSGHYVSEVLCGVANGQTVGIYK